MRPDCYIYRAIDWGWYPDPAVCLWLAVFGNTRTIAIMERTWYRTPARVVASDIVSLSHDMKVLDTFCDPTMFIDSKATEAQSIGDIFEQNGVPLTKAKNDRERAGYAVHELLSTILDDGLPMFQILESECPMLIQTFPKMRMDKNNTAKIAKGPDHWIISLSYFAMSMTGIPLPPAPRSKRPFLFTPRKPRELVIGRESSRRSHSL